MRRDAEYRRIAFEIGISSVRVRARVTSPITHVVAYFFHRDKLCILHGDVFTEKCERCGRYILLFSSIYN